jgi:imidazole glycerol-phosphate synthase subunit HisH
MIVIVNYGMGNLGSIINMLKKIGAEATISSDIREIEQADKIILPGVGHFDNGMKNLNDMGLTDALNKKVIKERTPFMGICLGTQLITKKSEEGGLPGLGWIDAETIKFDFKNDRNALKIPHMGWNTVTIQKPNYLFDEMCEEQRFYFVHSYHLVCNDREDILTTTFHGYEFVSSIQRDNILGVQFHPEKSHKYGMKILKYFAKD